jgi:hypothetical protein
MQNFDGEMSWNATSWNVEIEVGIQVVRMGKVK